MIVVSRTNSDDERVWFACTDDLEYNVVATSKEEVIGKLVDKLLNRIDELEGVVITVKAEKDELDRNVAALETVAMSKGTYLPRPDENVVPERPYEKSYEKFYDSAADLEAYNRTRAAAGLPPLVSVSEQDAVAPEDRAIWDEAQHAVVPASQYGRKEESRSDSDDVKPVE